MLGLTIHSRGAAEFSDPALKPVRTWQDVGGVVCAVGYAAGPPMDPLARNGNLSHQRQRPHRRVP